MKFPVVSDTSRGGRPRTVIELRAQSDLVAVLDRARLGLVNNSAAVPMRVRRSLVPDMDAMSQRGRPKAPRRTTGRRVSETAGNLT